MFFQFKYIGLALTELLTLPLPSAGQPGPEQLLANGEHLEF